MMNTNTDSNKKQKGLKPQITEFVPRSLSLCLSPFAPLTLSFAIIFFLSVSQFSHLHATV